tara:strand:- start:163 stop:534 length:372 start_codon:yes stop_codon:yes gene_type:complete
MVELSDFLDLGWKEAYFFGIGTAFGVAAEIKHIIDKNRPPKESKHKIGLQAELEANAPPPTNKRNNLLVTGPILTGIGWGLLNMNNEDRLPPVEATQATVSGVAGYAFGRGATIYIHNFALYF